MSASVSVTTPADSPPALHSGWPWTLVRQLPWPSIVVWGVNLPLSRAAVAVTTLNVEPGAYSPCVARLSSGEPLPALFSLAKFEATVLGL